MVPARFVVSVFVFVAPLVFRAPSDPAVGPGCWLCPWAAARPRAVRAASFARRVVSKPGQAPPPPTGTAARPSAPSGALHTGGTWCAGVWPGQDPPPLTGAAAWLSVFSGALHTGGACGSGVPGQAPPPHAGAAAWLSVFSGALHTGGACGSGVPGQDPPPLTGTAARPGSKLARALRSLRRPSRRWYLWFWCARPGPAATHGRRR